MIGFRAKEVNYGVSMLFWLLSCHLLFEEHDGIDHVVARHSSFATSRPVGHQTGSGLVLFQRVHVFLLFCFCFLPAVAVRTKRGGRR